jgi:mRNA interferase MazF
MIAPKPIRGELWQVRLDPIEGYEQAGTRPAVVVSEDRFNQGPAEMIVILPITGTQHNISYHVPVAPPEGGLTKQSFVMCDQIRAISTKRLIRRLGQMTPQTMTAIEIRLRPLLHLPTRP